MKLRVCAQSAINGEFTLCGDSFDIDLTEDDVEGHDVAGKGGTITCEKCCLQIQDMRDMRYRLKPRSYSHDQ